jgi:uncharacterized protein (DUF433 family)
MATKVITDARLEVPIYGLSEAARYLRLPIKTLEYWVYGTSRLPALIKGASRDPRALSYMNLLECHMLKAMKKDYDLKLPKIRKAIIELGGKFSFAHPIIEAPLYTNRVDVILKELDKYVNLSARRGGGEQLIAPEMLVYMERIERDQDGFRFFPFVMGSDKSEPKTILISPSVSFGKPVIVGTGISTAVIASRFNARESITDLADEYGIKPNQIEEAIRWEQSRPTAA